MKHKKLTEEFKLNLACLEKDKAYKEYIEFALIIEQEFRVDIKGTARTTPNVIK